MPFLTGFGKRKAIKYGTVFPGSNLTDFPKLFKIAADSDIAAELTSGGGIAVTLADETTEVPFGLYPSSDPTSGDLILRAKFPTLLTAASTGDVLGYLYYDAGETTVEDKAGVVANDYVLFAPLEEDPSGSAPQMRDWVTDSLLGTSSGSMASGDVVAGIVDHGLDFDTDDSIDFGSGANLDNLSNLTIEAWIFPKANASATYGIVAKSTSGTSSTTGWGLCYVTSSSNSVRRLSFSADWNSGDPLANSVATDIDTLNAWHCIACTYNFGNNSGGSDVLFRRNGASLGIASTGSSAGSRPDDSGQNLRVGTNGLMVIDELKISSVIRTNDWIDYGYADENANSDTFTLGSEEVAGGGGATADVPVFEQGMFTGGLATLCGGLG